MTLLELKTVIEVVVKTEKETVTEKGLAETGGPDPKTEKVGVTETEVVTGKEGDAVEEKKKRDGKVGRKNVFVLLLEKETPNQVVHLLTGLVTTCN